MFRLFSGSKRRTGGRRRSPCRSRASSRSLASRSSWWRASRSRGGLLLAVVLLAVVLLAVVLLVVVLLVVQPVVLLQVVQLLLGALGSGRGPAVEGPETYTCGYAHSSHEPHVMRPPGRGGGATPHAR